MTDSNERQQTLQDKPCQTFAEFLQNTPPNQSAQISDLAALASKGESPGIVVDTVNRPLLRLYCPYHSCNGDRFFRCVWVSSDGESLDQQYYRFFYISYLCSNCQVTNKVFSLMARVHQHARSQGECHKIGEHPPFGPYVPSKLIALIGPDKEDFLQGHRCENQGFGVGAFAYYRRVVENQKNRILKRILKVAQKLGTTQDTIDKLNSAIEETQFKRALDMAKDVIPDKLFINNQNPILALHHVLSGGVHEFSDQRCLELARDVRVVLGALSERLSFVLKDDAEVGRALSNLMNLDNN